MSSRRRVVVIGLDSFTPVMADRYLASHMPALHGLCERGLYSEMVPTMPPTTPAGWTTVATGAWPSTHGVEGFAVHRPGDPLDHKVHSLTADASRAEFLWQAAARAGRRSIVVKYPLSWPTTGGDRLLQVDGAAGWGGMKCVWDLAPSGCWDTAAEAAPAAGAEIAVGAPEWMTRDQDNLDDETVGRLRVRDAAPWQGLPAGAEPLWETELRLGGGDGAGAVVQVLALRLDGAPRVLVSTARRHQPRLLAGPGGWTGWLQVGLADGRRGHVRFKLMALDLAARRLRLYQSQVHSDQGWTHPPELAAELTRVAGPFVEWTESYDRLQGWIDDDTQLEIYQQHVEWLGAACRQLLRERDWDLFMTQLHILDMAYHVYWATVDPTHPDHDPGSAGRYHDLLARVHALADRLVATIVEELDEHTLVLVLGEHGHDSYHTNFLVNHLLLKEGLLALRKDRRSGAARIDWSQTGAYASSYRIFLNVKGRDPDGTVLPDARDETAARVIEALYGAVDERTGQHPIRLALRQEDARGLGLYGPSMGDVVFAMAPGYQSRTTFHLPSSVLQGHTVRRSQVPLFRRTRLFREFTGEHDTSLPWTRAIRTVLVGAGPGIARQRLEVPVRILDVAATVSDFLGIDPPAANQGSSMLPLLARRAGRTGEREPVR
jgi:predicted AlkP superfamily phosphohydrolase/phosphomutase